MLFKLLSLASFAVVMVSAAAVGSVVNTSSLLGSQTNSLETAGIYPSASTLNPELQSAAHNRRTTSSVSAASHVISVLGANGTLLGYVDTSYYPTHITTDINSALHVSVTGNSTVNIVELNGPDSSNTLFGAIFGFIVDPTDNVSAGSHNYCLLTGVSASSPNQRDAKVGNSYYYHYQQGSESAIWSVAGTSITAQWVNTDGSKPATTLIFFDGFLALTGDLKAMETYFGPNRAYLVTFFLVPI